MFNYQEFDDVFDFDASYSYEDSSIHTIEANRKELEGLFIDKVFKALGIKRRRHIFNRRISGIMLIVVLSPQVLPSQE